MSYAKILPEQSIYDILPVSDEVEYEYVLLRKIITNYPDTGEGWEPEYSADDYATFAPGQDIEIPPENEVDTIMHSYLHNHVNHYWGVEIPTP